LSGAGTQRDTAINYIKFPPDERRGKYLENTAAQKALIPDVIVIRLMASSFSFRHKSNINPAGPSAKIQQLS
jgi:hypothetical protein